jgi:dihydroorotate dehydrogenase electron transfer subunit
MSLSSSSSSLMRVGTVVANRALCDEHLRLTLRLPGRTAAAPGQFVHLAPIALAAELDDPASAAPPCPSPLLRRAFSIAGLRATDGGEEIDVIYRVVGTGTQWMASLTPGLVVSVLGPLGNSFPISKDKDHAWLVAGGVGLPPMLWLAESLSAAGKQVIAFCGAQRASLLALELDPNVPPDVDAKQAALSARAFARSGAAVVLATDDGSLGFAGHLGAALDAFSQANRPDPDDLVIYTCGPERMMHFVAGWAADRGIDCYVCMERAMACGTGTCQSCAVEVRAPADKDGWRYALCCTEGPVFPARNVLWQTPTTAR